MKFLISVIVPLYKGRRYISHIINMVENNARILKENYKWCPVELIFVNDYPDEYIDESMKSDCVDIKYIILSKNKGIHGARVEGLKSSQGEYILFLDQDDDIKNEWMHSQLEHIKDAPAVVCDGLYRNGRKIYGSPSVQKNAIARTNIRSYKILSPGQVLIRRECIPKEWKEKILKHNGNDDLYLWLLILSAYEELNCNYHNLFTHNENDCNSGFKWKIMLDGKKEVLKLLKNNDNLDSYIISELDKQIEQTEIKFKPYIMVDELIKRDIIIDTDKKVILYGMGVYGNKLLKLLRKNNVEVVCGVDKDAKNITKKDLDVYSIEDKFPPADLMIVTAEFVFDEVSRKYKGAIEVIKMSDFLRKYIV